MFDPISAGVGAAAGFAGPILNYLGQKDANDQNWDQFVSNQIFNQNQITAARDYNTYMSNTAVQRRMADLKAAGINPMLAGQDQASSPSSPTANPGVGNSAQNPFGGISQGLQAAFQGARLITDLKQADTETALKAAQAITENARANSEVWSARETEERIDLMAKQRKALEIGLGSARAKTAAEKNKAELDVKYGNTERIMNLINQGTSSAKDVVNAITDIYPPTKVYKTLRGVGKYTERDMLNAAKGKGVLVP